MKTKVVECATDGCTTTFPVERRRRHTYCAECVKDRKKAHYEDWYYNRGGRNHLKEKHKRTYPEKREEICSRLREKYAEGGKERQQARRATPEAREKRRRYDAKRLQKRRERRIAEMLAGGRPFRIRQAPKSEKYLTGIADYKSEQFFTKVVEPKKKKMMEKSKDPLAWDGVFRR